MSLLELAEAAAQPWQVVWANQNGPRPAKPYFRLQVRGRTGSMPAIGALNDQGHAPISEHVTLRVDLECFGLQAFEKVSAAASRLRYPSVTNLADALKIGVGTVGQVRDLTALMSGSQYEERAMLEFTAHIGSLAYDNLGLIEHVVFECPGYTEDDTGHAHTVSAPGATALPAV